MKNRIENSRFLKAVHCQNHGERPPVWIMRQAGRFLPEYQKLRAQFSLNQLFRDPKKIVTVTLQPLKRYPLDAAILFADILHVLLPLGCAVDFPQKGGVNVGAPKRLKRESVEKALPFVSEGIERLKKELSVPLIGFCGGPFTVAHYLLGKKPEKVLYQNPEEFSSLLNLITEVSIDYLKMQIEAGVDAIQIFDSWAGTLPLKQIERFVLPSLKRLIAALKVPVLVFSRGIAFYVKKFALLGADGISFDGARELAEIRREMPSHMAVQGNLPPAFLYSPVETVRFETKKHLDSMKGDPGFIVNLGHGILPDTPLESVQAFIETVVTS